MEAVTDGESSCSHCGQPAPVRRRRLLSVARFDQASMREVYPAIFSAPSQFVCCSCYRLLSTLVKTKAQLDARRREDSHHPVHLVLQAPLMAQEHDEEDHIQRPPAKRSRIDVSEHDESQSVSKLTHDKNLQHQQAKSWLYPKLLLGLFRHPSCLVPAGTLIKVYVRKKENILNLFTFSATPM